MLIVMLAFALQVTPVTPRTPLPAVERQTLPTPEKPAPEAIALGTELARFGTLSTIAPTLVERDIVELGNEDKTLTPAEQAELAMIGRAEGKAALDRINGQMGLAYAKRLSLADLQALVAFNRTPAADRMRAAQAPALMEAMQAIGSVDVKKATAAAFCAKRKKLCNRD